MPGALAAVAQDAAPITIEICLMEDILLLAHAFQGKTAFHVQHPKL